MTILRVRCLDCEAVFSIQPSFIVRYKRYDTDAIEKSATSLFITEDSYRSACLRSRSVQHPQGFLACLGCPRNCWRFLKGAKRAGLSPLELAGAGFSGIPWMQLVNLVLCAWPSLTLAAGPPMVSTKFLTMSIFQPVHTNPTEEYGESVEIQWKESGGGEIRTNHIGVMDLWLAKQLAILRT